MTSPTLRRARLVFVDGSRGVWLAVSLFALVMVVIFGGIGMIVNATGDMEGSTWTSVWEQAMYGSRYFPLSMGFVLVFAFLPLATAHGVTRRSYVLGVSGVMAAIGVAVSVLLTVGYLVEYGLFDLGGAVARFHSPHLFDSGSAVGWVFLESVLVVTANIVAGFFLATAFYRWRWWKAVLALPLLLLPLLAVEALVMSGWPGDVMTGLLGVERAPLGVVVPGAVLIVVGMLAAGLGILRSTDIRNC